MTRFPCGNNIIFYSNHMFMSSNISLEKMYFSRLVSFWCIHSVKVQKTTWSSELKAGVVDRCGFIFCNVRYREEDSNNIFMLHQSVKSCNITFQIWSNSKVGFLVKFIGGNSQSLGNIVSIERLYNL